MTMDEWLERELAELRAEILMWDHTEQAQDILSADVSEA